MNTDNKTTKELAFEWFSELLNEDKKRISQKHFNHSNLHHLSDQQIESIYKWEHPTQPEQTIKEEGKTIEELKEENKLLREALEVIITSPEWIKNYGGGEVDNKAKKALKK